MEGKRFSDSPRYNGIPGSIVFSFLAICLIMVIAGCKTTTVKSTIMKQHNIKHFTSQEIQIRVSEFSSHFAHMVEASADEIRSQTTDPDIRSRALVWKIYAISECQSSATSADPLMAIIDMWTFVLQMADYFETGEGKNIFGELQPIAVNTARSLEEQMVNMVKEKALPEGFVFVQGFVNDWAEKHPIKTRFYTHDSTLPLLADIYRVSQRGAMATMSDIDQGIRDVSNRIWFLADNLPRQVRWQAEYLMETTVSGQKMEETLNNVNTLVKSIDRMARVVEQSPELIERERTAVFAEIREERKAVLQSISEQRIETIQEVNKEIIEVIKAIHEERVATVKDLRNERIETLEFISKRAEGLVESLFWRVSLCLAGLVVVGIACAAGLIWMKAMSNRNQV
jgi:hypothetical protein